MLSRFGPPRRHIFLLLLLFLFLAALPFFLFYPSINDRDISPHFTKYVPPEREKNLKENERGSEVEEEEEVVVEGGGGPLSRFLSIPGTHVLFEKLPSRKSQDKYRKLFLERLNSTTLYRKELKKERVGERNGEGKGEGEKREGESRGEGGGGEEEIPAVTVGLSLVVANRTTLLGPMLDSLFASDLARHNLVLFIWTNFPNLENSTRAYFKNFSTPIPLIVLASADGKNERIVFPRIRIYDAMCQIRKVVNQSSSLDPKDRSWNYKFDYLLELHDDMVFFPLWFDKLLGVRDRYPCVSSSSPTSSSTTTTTSSSTSSTSSSPSTSLLNKGCAIIMPFIISLGGPKGIKSYSVPRLEARVNNVTKDRVLSRCIPVHPWLLDLNALDTVGYYDPQYAPQELEDTDFYYRLDKAGYRSAAVQSSFVYHSKEATRETATIYWKKNSAKFKSKHGVEVEHFVDRILNQCVPALLPSGLPGWKDSVDYRYPGDP